jgi:RNA recognition motif-containing protein
MASECIDDAEAGRVEFDMKIEEDVLSPCNRQPQQWSQSRQVPQEYRHGHGRAPRNVNLVEQYQAASNEQPPTTLMIRNIPNRYTQQNLIQEMKSLGLGGTFDFLYVPLDKGTMSNVGYAFVNFVDHTWAERCMEKFQKHRFKKHHKVAVVSVAHIQGLEANLAHYENAAVNSAKLKQRRPVVFANISCSLTEALGLNDDH